MAIRLIDTNVFSYLFRGHPWGSLYRRHLRGHVPALSFMSVAELYELGARSGWGPGLYARLHMSLRNHLILQSSPELCRRWAAVRYERRAQPISVDDAWIAATALEHGLELLTHNAADFQGIAGLRVITEAP